MKKKSYIRPVVGTVILKMPSFMDTVSTHTSTTPATGGHKGGRAREFAWEEPVVLEEED